MRVRIVVVKSDPASTVDIPHFLEVNWQANGYVPALLRIQCSVLILWYSFDVSSFSKKIRNHLLESASCANNYFRIRSFHV